MNWDGIEGKEEETFQQPSEKVAGPLACARGSEIG